MPKIYQPVSPGFYKTLESLANLNKEVEIIFRKDNELVKERGIIQTLLQKPDGEFLLMNRNEIRLDSILSADGIEPPERS